MNKEPYFDEKKRFHHPCCIPECRKEGCIGIGVNLLKGKLGRWYCGPHYRELEHKRQKEKTKPAPVYQEKQGKLF